MQNSVIIKSDPSIIHQLKFFFVFNNQIFYNIGIDFSVSEKEIIDYEDQLNNIRSQIEKKRLKIENIIINQNNTSGKIFASAILPPNYANKMLKAKQNIQKLENIESSDDVLGGKVFVIEETKNNSISIDSVQRKINSLRLT